MDSSIASNDVRRAKNLISVARKFRGGRIAVEFVLQFAATAIFLSAISLLITKTFSVDLLALTASAGVAIVGTATKFVQARKLIASDSVELAEKLNRPSRLRGPNWIYWTLLLGAGMAVVIGIAMGSLDAFSSGREALIGGSKATTIIGWILLSLISAIPGAFAISFTQRRRSPPFPNRNLDAS